MTVLTHSSGGFGVVLKQSKTYFKMKDTSGQSTVEFAIVLGALISILIALGLLKGLFSDGKIFDHVIGSASHNVGQSIQGIVDVFVF